MILIFDDYGRLAFATTVASGSGKGDIVGNLALWNYLYLLRRDTLTFFRDAWGVEQSRSYSQRLFFLGLLRYFRYLSLSLPSVPRPTLVDNGH